jgi:NDP-sugar pyrophosphorylase family protein
MPKALVRVGGQPLLWHVIMKLKEAGYERLVVNVHHFANQIVGYLADNNHFGLDIRISDETEALLETGGGIKKALPLFDPSEPILIHNVDILSNLEFNSLSMVAPPDALLVVSQRNTKRYLLFDDEMILDGWTNIETGEVRSPYPALDPTDLKRLAFSGIHMIWPRLFPLFQDMPERFGIIDFYLKYCHQCAFLGYEKKDLRLMDVGKLDTLDQAESFASSLNSKI